MVDFSTSSRRVLDRKIGQQWTVSRVLFQRGVSPSLVRIIHLGDALPRRSSALTRALAPSPAHASRRVRAEERFGRVTLLQRPYSSLLPEGLASPPVARLSRVGSYPTISPLPVRGGHTAHRAIGGVISVALSLESPRVGVADFRTLRSPDFPPADGSCPPAILRPPPAAPA